MRDIDKVISELTRLYPDLSAEQLRVTHPNADDAGLWFFRHPASQAETQLESSSGACPFLFETSEHAGRATAKTVTEAIALVADGLGLPAAA